MKKQPNSPSRRRLDLSERDLVLAFKGGDSHAYAVIYREFRPIAESICLRILGNAEDAQEAAQETMLRVFQGLPRFNGRYLLRAWVARIATNVCLDTIRRRGRRVNEVESPAAEELEGHDQLVSRQFSEDPGEVVERIEEGRRVRTMLNDLPEHHRNALLMREYDGLSHEEIAMKLGMTAPQVKALLHRAKKGFRRAWQIETGRASGFVLPGLLAVPGRWLRKMLWPAKEAVAEAAAPVIHLSAQPVVAQATVAVGERVTAAAGAILVAGTIGIGASVLPNRSQPAPQPKSPRVVVAQPAPAESLAATPKAPSLAPASPTAEGSPESSAATKPRPKPSYDESPSPEPSGGGSTTPAPTPVTEPSPSPSPAPPAPAPAYDMSFRMNHTSDRLCGCDSKSRLAEQSSTSGSPGGSMRFGQGAQGAIFDAEGDAALEVRVSYRGSVAADSGSLNVDFTVTSRGQIYTYRAVLDMVGKTKIGDGWRYRFSGSYGFVGGPDQMPIPSQGALAVSLDFWRDGTIYNADLLLG